MRHLLKNKKNMHTMVNELRSPIPQVEGNKKQYTTRDLNRADRASQFHHITGQPVTRILHAVDTNIVNNIPIIRENVGMAEDTY